MLRATLLASGACLYATGAFAQEPLAPASTSVGQVEEVVVTARKRAESVQDVPVTIGVVTPTAIANSGVSSLLQLQSVAPDVNLAKGPTGAEIGVTIRGLGSEPGEPAFDSSVSLFVDGVYAPRTREFAASMFDIDRIEVIRGTQAALLGKNTSLGAISLVTRRPGDQYETDLRASYEFERGSKLVTGGVDIPISDTLQLRIAGQANWDEGWVHDVITHSYATRTDDKAIRATLVWNPTDDLDITAMFQHDQNNNYGSPVEQIASTGAPELLAALAGYPGTVDTGLNRVNALSSPSLPDGEQHERLRLDKYSLTANWTIADHTLTSITGYSQDADANISDVDMLPGDYALRGVNENFHQFSQELRIVSPSDKALTYVVGALYLKSRLKNATGITADYPFSPLPGIPLTGAETTHFGQEDSAVSGFAQGDYKLIAALHLTAGLRWTQETKQADLDRVVTTPGLLTVFTYPAFAPFSLQNTEANLDYSAGLQYDLTPDYMAYISYGKGTKSGGFAESLSNLNDSPYKKEVAKTVEVGVKLQDPDRKWLLNGAIFDTRVDGFQLVTFNGIDFNIGNADLSSQGFELQGEWHPLEGLKLFINNTYAYAQDRHTHDPIPLAPKWTGSAGFAYRGMITGQLDWMADGSIDYRSKRYYQQDPMTSPPGQPFTTLNLGVALGANDDSWELRLIGRNLTDATELAFDFPTPLLPPGNQSGVAERGRTIALQLSITY
jgi:iron complex outermembrane receptor protein